MKQLTNLSIFIVFLFSLFYTASSFSQNDVTFLCVGNTILDPCNNQFIPRGVNYSLADDWNFPGNLATNRELSSQIALANPNAVRIQWFVDYGQATRPELTIASLDSVISRFAALNIVSIVELHDFTHIHTDTAAFNDQIVGWWTSAPVLELLEKHKSHVFLNVANEYGPAKYPAPSGVLNPNYDAQVVVWVQHYKSVISQLREAGIDVPIIIDAPNYGMDSDAVIAYGAAFSNHDPLHQIVMSCHAYWNVTPLEMEAIVNQLSNLTIPVVLGEIGNVNAACIAIPLTALLTACQTKKMGWLAWSWHRDGDCESRNMTANDILWNSPTDGQFSTLTSYGQLLVNNETFGLAAHAVKSDFSCTVGIETIELDVRVYPNPVTDILYVQYANSFSSLEVSIYNMQGQLMGISHELQIDVRHLNQGVYILKVKADERSAVIKFLK